MAPRSTYSGVLQVGVINLPIAVYKARDEFGLPGSLFHQDCGGKVRQKQFCEIHPDDEEIVVFSGIAVDDRIVPIGPELRNELLERKAAFEVVSAHPMSKLSSWITYGGIIPQAIYQIAPNRNKVQSVEDANHRLLATLLNRLEKKKVFLLCTIGMGGMKRYGILLAGGLFYTLTYREELREEIDWDGDVDPAIGSAIDGVLDKITTGDLPEISMQPIQKRVAAWIESLTAPIKKPRKSNPKKRTARKKVTV